jgi:hypothetical protein
MVGWPLESPELLGVQPRNQKLSDPYCRIGQYSLTAYAIKLGPFGCCPVNLGGLGAY